ncbi:TRAP transporter substrate-binding protein [Senegalia massiliensis]|uniref:TRAP transporter substrate-binding protein n=1 Tax=Senegalia massiliensis TaxID=1720316 RepID=A0A845R124_9CLOT|nr:TRAP transporter substrate-binding protein [Senegalia massiliensis]
MLSIGLILVLLSTALIGCSDDSSSEKGEKIEWKLGHLGNEEHIWNKTALKFAEVLEEKTDGQIKVKVFPNEQLGNEVDNINMIQSGTADMVVAGESMQNWASKSALMAVPYAFNDTESMRNIIDGDLGKEINEQIEEKVGLKPVYYHVRAPRNLTSNKEIKSPEDLDGFKMRVPNVPLFVDAWEAAGANPQVMAFSEVFTALQQNVIDGQENPYDLIHSANFNEVQEYVNETEHVNGWVYVLVGKKQFESLTPELQDAVMEAGQEAQEFADNLFEEEISKYKKELQEKGMKINSNVDKEAFKEAMKPAIEKSLNEEQLDLYNRILEEQK